MAASLQVRALLNLVIPLLLQNLQTQLERFARIFGLQFSFASRHANKNALNLSVVQVTPFITADDLEAMTAQDSKELVVLDVRSTMEFEQG